MRMANQSSDFNLKMLNLWIGLCRGEAGLPLDIRHLGYKHKWIELRFLNSHGEDVKPELIIASDRIGHTVLLEWKAGANTEQDQLRRYSGVDQQDLVQKVALTPVEASSHDTCVLGSHRAVTASRYSYLNTMVYHFDSTGSQDKN
jgi:hypothetical protein